MNFGELKTQFEGLLKRRDLTTTQRDVWLQMSISRLQRALRIPAMEKSIETTTDSEIQDGLIAVPVDYLELKAISIDAEDIELQAKTLREVLFSRTTTGIPRMYVRRGGSFVLGQYPQDDLTIRIDYWAEFDPLSADTDENALSIIAPFAIIYGALVLAADYFLDKRAPLFRQAFQEEFQSLQDQADRDEMSNAVVAPTHTYPEDR
jgi:hypothetical protein